MKPPIKTLAPAPTTQRVEMLANFAAPGVGVGGGGGGAEPVTM